MTQETVRIGHTETDAFPAADTNETTDGRIRLLLSGGGNRAMLGGAGAIAYLAQQGWWDRIDEVVSVSGGSTANAAVLTGGADSYERTLLAVATFFSRARTDLGQPWKQRSRVRALGQILLTVGGLIYLVLGAFGLLPTPPILRTAAGGLVVGLLAPVLASLLIRRGAAAYLRAYLGSLTAGIDVQLGAFAQSTRQHVICATGLATGYPYYLWSGGESFYAGGDLSVAPTPHVPTDLWGVPSQADHSIADAVFASSSLPTLARVSTSVPPAAETMHETELLIDGGVSGIFGLQVSNGLRDQATGGGKSPTAQGHVVVIDSGRHLTSTSRVGRALTRLSIANLLARWLKVSLEANYRRDLAELEDAHLVRVAEGFDELPPTADPLLLRYDELRRRTAKMGLANYNAERALNAFVTGWVGCALTLDSECSPRVIDSGLGALGVQMGLDTLFVDYWQGLA